MDKPQNATPAPQPATKDTGPAAKKKQGRWGAFWQAVGEAIGQAKFGS